MKICGIYKIQSTIHPERCYIGSAIDIKDRIRCHKKDLIDNNHHDNIKLHNHVNKYGISDLKYSIIATCQKEDLVLVEQGLIWSYKPFFNIRTIAENNLGVKHSKESCERQSKKMKGKHNSPATEFKKGMTTWNKGTKGLTIGWNKGMSISEEHKANLSKAQIGQHHSPATEFKKGCKGNPFEKEHIPWNKDKKGVMPIPWNKGLTKETNEIVKNIADAKLGLKFPYKKRKKYKLRTALV